MISAPEYLHRAAELMQERGKQYDQPNGERSMGSTISAFNAVTGHDLSEAEGWLLMLLLKQVRLFQKPGFHKDSAEDAVAYAALLAESKQQEARINKSEFVSAPPAIPFTKEEEEAFSSLFLCKGKA